ncbi:probable E3 ubiquitin-protein ligase HERC4 [Trichogramma pretiosum]|uniref:probable E3 ubiquitin-protein ligase HERC4 n=1 Tax=Trichogramma pretiosum TaxID=7493 RepID=UPI0006C950E5|nr:probable E3 ubiquitin-protein ligase HERC4 [Trichogramma pretiosum]
MPKLYVSGLITSEFIKPVESTVYDVSLEAIHLFPFNIDDSKKIEIGWDYFILWNQSELILRGKKITNEKCGNKLQLPASVISRLEQVIAGSENIFILTNDSKIWIYNIYTDNWRRVPNFITNLHNNDVEKINKINHSRCTIAMTDLGQIYNIPLLINNSSSVKFVDIACGFDHTLLLAENGYVYSMGMGTRGQLGHGDLEDCDEPKLIEALAGLKVTQISAKGWHNAVITDQGDLYTWGWNNHNQLGLNSIENVLALPTLVNFISSTMEELEINVIKVQCGNQFTICRTDTGEFWGCGNNKYNQLGVSSHSLSTASKFEMLTYDNIIEPIQDFKCYEWSSCIFTN